MGAEENSDRGPYLSLDEIRAMILEIKAGHTDIGSGRRSTNREIKLDVDGEDLVFFGERELCHSCSTMRCSPGEHIVFRVSFANLLITRKAKRLVRNFLKDL